MVNEWVEIQKTLNPRLSSSENKTKMQLLTKCMTFSRAFHTELNPGLLPF